MDNWTKTEKEVLYGKKLNEMKAGLQHYNNELDFYALFSNNKDVPKEVKDAAIKLENEVYPKKAKLEQRIKELEGDSND